MSSEPGDRFDRISHDHMLSLVPRDIIVRAVEYLRDALTDEDRARVMDAYAERGPDWWMWTTTLRLPGPEGGVIPRGHFGFGMAVRNALRVNVCPDKDIPLGDGWEELYVPVVEIAVGIREMPA